MTIVAFVATKGGVGKSMLTRLVASELAVNEMPTRVLCADHPQHTTWNWFAGIKDKSAISPLLDVKRIDGLDTMAEALAEADRFDGYVLVDVKGDTSTELELALAIADVVIVPSRPTMDDAQPAIEVIRHMRQQNGHSPGNVWVVLNDLAVVAFQTPAYRAVVEAFRANDIAVFETPLFRRAMFAELANGYATLSEMATTRQRAEQVVRARDNIARLLEEIVVKAAGDAA